MTAITTNIERPGAGFAVDPAKGGQIERVAATAGPHGRGPAGLSEP